MANRKHSLSFSRGANYTYGVINHGGKLNVEEPAEQHTRRPQDSKQILKVWQWAFLSVGQAMACALEANLLWVQGFVFRDFVPIDSQVEYVAEQAVVGIHGLDPLLAIPVALHLTVVFNSGQSKNEQCL